MASPSQSQPNNLGQGQPQSQSQSQGQPQQLFSPNSMAVLSPPASRYAFEPSLQTSSIPPIGLQQSAGSPLSTPADNSNSKITNTTITSIGNLIDRPMSGFGYSNEIYDVPAFEPNTEIVLQNFTNDLKTFTKWIKNLNFEEQKTTMDVFLSTIHEDVIHYLKSKIVSSDMKKSSIDGDLVFNPPPNNNNIYQPQVRPVSPLLALNNEANTLDSLLEQNNESSIIQPQAMSSITPFSAAALLDSISRPKSAGPSHYDLSMGSFQQRQQQQQQQLQQQQQQQQPQQQPQQQQQQLQQPQQQLYSKRQQQPYYQTQNYMLSQNQQPLMRVFSPDVDPSGFQRRTRELLDPPTHHLQQQSHESTQHYGLTSTADFAGQNAIKLNHSLSTIKSRTKMDNNKSSGLKSGGHSSNSLNHSMNNLMMSQQQQQPNEDESRGRHHLMLGGQGRYGNGIQSTSLPPVNRLSSYQMAQNLSSAMSSLSISSNDNNKSFNASPIATTRSNTEQSSHIHSPIPRSPSLTIQSNNKPTTPSNLTLNPISSPKSPMPKDIASKQLLSDIPLWLKTLRLHKYTDNLKLLKWQDMLDMSDEDLVKLGVGTIGARNKLMKSFAFAKENLHD